MDSARWERIQEVFHAAAERPETERTAFLDQTCGDDQELKAEVIAMLEGDLAGPSLLDRGLPEDACLALDALESFSLHEIGPYRLKKILGEGGMGVVWLAEREDTGTPVAIKVLPHARLSPLHREGFKREIKALARLNHPYIAHFFDAGTLADRTPWFVMEYVDGVPLTDYCRNQELSIEKRLRLFRMVCEAVQYAHAQAPPLVHRDLKPSNVLVRDDGTPRLLDFGIAKEMRDVDSPEGYTGAGLRFFSRKYAAPEWIEQGVAGVFSDIYSLGVILNEVLAELPEKNRSATFAERELSLVCAKAMHADVSRRYPSVEALIRDIDHFLKHEPLEARPDSWPYRARMFVLRNRQPVLAAASFGFVASLVVFFVVRLAKERDRANSETTTATAINRYLTDDLLGQISPFTGGKGQETFAETVTRAASHIDVEFVHEPFIAARLHQALARAFDNRSDFPPARKEYDRAAQLYAQAEGPLSQNAILVRLQKVGLDAKSYEGTAYASAKATLRDADAAISDIAKPRDDVRVWLFIAKGLVALDIDNDAHAASEDFSAALRLARSVPAFDQLSLLKMQQPLAMSYLRQGDGGKAESSFREAGDAFAKLEGPDSPNVLQTRLYLAQALLGEGKFTATIEESSRIYPSLAAKLGEDHEETMHLLGTRAAAEGSLGMWDAAIRDDLALYPLAVRKQGSGAFFSIGTLSDAGTSECAAGRYRDGERDTRRAYKDSRRAFGAKAGLTGAAGYALAVCLLGSDKLDEASEILKPIDAKLVAQLLGNPIFGDGITLAEGRIAAGRGDYTLAQRDAEAVAPVFSAADAPFIERQSFEKLKAAIAAHSR